MIDTFVAVVAGLSYVPIWIITGLNLHFCMQCDKCRYKSAKTQSSIWYKRTGGLKRKKKNRASGMV